MHLLRSAVISALSIGANSLAIEKPAIIKARDGWSSSRCYSDNVSGRALPNGVSVPGGSDSMTNEACQTACLAAGYKIAGTEYGGECWCGNSMINGGALVSDGCNMQCKGDKSQICGGPNRLSVSTYDSSGGPSSSPSPAGKRGLSYNDNNPSKNAVYANMFKGYEQVSWAYNWGYPSYGLDPQFEFVPMLWGLPGGDQPGWTAAVQTPGTKSILSFNEPDLNYAESSRIKPADAAAGQLRYIEPFTDQVKVGLPSVLWNNVGSTSGGSYNTRQWTEYFLGNCTGCHFDYAAIHYYQACNPADGQSGAEWFKGNVTDAYNTLRLPIWITEFHCYGSEDEEIGFLNAILPWLDAQHYVERYSYFGTFPEFLINAAGNALSAVGLAYATI